MSDDDITRAAFRSKFAQAVAAAPANSSAAILSRDADYAEQVKGLLRHLVGDAGSMLAKTMTVQMRKDLVITEKNSTSSFKALVSDGASFNKIMEFFITEHRVSVNDGKNYSSKRRDEWRDLVSDAVHQTILPGQS